MTKPRNMSWKILIMILMLTFSFTSCKNIKKSNPDDNNKIPINSKQEDSHDVLSGHKGDREEDIEEDENIDASNILDSDVDSKDSVKNNSYGSSSDELIKEGFEEVVEDKNQESDLSIEEGDDLTIDENDKDPATITDPKIIVKKSDRILELWDGDSLFGRYPIGLGFEPLGDKQKEGDGRTPEGTYYVCTRNNYSRFYLSLGVSYPNVDDAKEALEAGVIDHGTFQQIEDAFHRNTQPPWNTSMGGEIMIHGHGAQSDWTAGCVAVDNNIMDILWESCPLGTPIIIEP